MYTYVGVDCVVEALRVKGIVWPSERLTLEGMDERVGPFEMLGEMFAPRFTVPEKPPVLVIAMAEEPSIPGLTHKVVGFAVTVKSGFCAAAKAVDSKMDVRMTVVKPRVVPSFCFRVVPKILYIFIVMCL